MALKILCAGCPPEEKERAESDVRRALGRRADAEAWMVSLVKMQGRWSVTLDGPATRGVTCVAADGRITESIVEALGPAPAPPDVPVPVTAPVPVPVPAASKPPVAARPPAAAKPPAPTSPPYTPPAPAPPVPAAAPVGPGPRQDRHQCASCGESFLVRYESQGDEGEETVAVACPHCWHRNYVLVAENAAESRDFTAEKG